MIKTSFFSNVKKLIKQEKYFGNSVNHKFLDDLGFFVIKKGLSESTTNKYRNKFLKYLDNKKLNKTKKHPVEVKIEKINFFQNIYKDKQLKNLVKGFYNGQVGSDFFRIVKKDIINSSAVFCHQDTGYQMGSFDRYSLFICLTDNNNLNGGMVLYPSTHKFGYLGDAGEISKNVTKKFQKVCPDLKAGDILIMHSALWHESDKNFIKKNRIYFEIHIQNLNDPNTKYNIIGKRKKILRQLPNTDMIFSNSRVTRIINFKKKINLLEKKINKKHD